MAKDDYEKIEGGDSGSDVLDADVGREAPGEPEETSSDDERDEREVDAVPKKPEDYRFKDGDDEWDKDQKDEKEEVEEKEEVKEVKEGEDKAEKVEVGEKKELSEEEIQAEKIKEDVIKYLEESEGGTKYRVKGKDYDLRDLAPQEFRNRFSLAGRAHERLQEIAEREKIINERERLAEDGARRSQEIMHKYGGEKSEDTSKELPDFCKPDSDDDYETKALKKGYANLYSKVDKLERGQEERDFSFQKQDLFRQLDSLEKEFPMLSKSEVIAVKSMPEYAGVDMRLIAENSHNARISDEYLDSVFKTRPDKLREIEEKAIEKHLMKNPKVRKVSRKKSSTVASEKVSSGKKKSPRTFDEIEDQLDGFKKGLEDFDED